LKTPANLKWGGGSQTGGAYSGGYADGPADQAAFEAPQGVAADADGTLYVADTGNHAVRRIREGRVTTLAVSAEHTKPPVKPRGLLVRGDSLLVSDLFAQTLIELPLARTVFSDVPEDAWYAGALAEAVERGLISGVGDGRFAPDEPVTRGAFAVMLSRLHRHGEGHAVVEGADGFADVLADSWYGSAVRWAASEGLVNGMEDGLFYPDRPVTREQLITMLYRLISRDEGAAQGHAPIDRFADAGTVAPYAAEAMQWAVGNGILTGNPDGTLTPAAPATRAQTVTLLLAVMTRLEQP